MTIEDEALPWGTVELVYDDEPITAESLRETRLAWLRERTRPDDALARVLGPRLEKRGKR